MIKRIYFLDFFILILIGTFYPIFVNAVEIDELQSRIEARNSDIRELEEEIKKYQNQIDMIGKDKKSLTGDIRTLDILEKKLKTDIALTKRKINSNNSEINRLNNEISDKEDKIDQNKKALSQAIRAANQFEDTSFLEMIFSGDSISDFLDRTESLRKFQTEVNKYTSDLESLKRESLLNKIESERKKKELVIYESDLSDKRQLTEINKEEKNNLLQVTKNKESNYKKILDEKIALKNAFEAELSDYESQLQMQIDPNSVPQRSKGVLSWPLEKIRITQYFGNTAFAMQNAQVYNGSGHNGVDFGVSVGTKIIAALDGVVEGVGDTDVACRGASYGKWVLIKHDNGLSTLYAHLSLIKVTAGQSVITGEIIGYSGNTGYSTGPHLHFTTYASQGVKIMKYNFKSCKGKSVSMPLSDKKAYLNPLSYLPKI